MKVQDTLKSLMNHLTSGFDTEEPEDIIPYSTPATENNLALDENYSKQNTTLKTVDSKVVTHAAFNKNSNTGLVVCEPRSYSESVDFVKHLKDHKILLVNLNFLDSAQACRLVDFLCGATHALNGTQKKISENVFAFAPMGVPIAAETQKDKKVQEALWSE